MVSNTRAGVSRPPLLAWTCVARRRLPAVRAVSTENRRTAEAPTTTERIFRRIAERGNGSEAGGAGGATTYEALKRADAAWHDLRTRLVYGPKPDFVRITGAPLPSTPDFDVVVCGGTLGIFLACSLQLAGLKVAVLERGPVRGREQEWNISRKELGELVKLGVLTAEEVEECISVEFNPIRSGFHGSKDIWVQDVLNLGVRPDRLVEKARRRFEGIGGCLVEHTPLNGLWVHPNGTSLETSSTSSGASASSSSSSGRLTARLVLDCMGHASPIVRQVRFGRKPDGVCLVVGTCARGFKPEKNTTGDLIYTFTPSQPAARGGESGRPSHLQYFWEAFPAGSGPSDRTTYMFTYVDAHPDRPPLEALLDDYWRLMPEYQGVDLDQLEVLRILFGCFPTYRDSPLVPEFDRVLQVGDASGIQSPLSFGGFGALSRHLQRLTSAVKEALEADMLDSRSLALINAYNPGLSGAWMLQRAMSIPAGARSYDPNFINHLLGSNFAVMESLGPDILKPFLQDVIQFQPMGQTLLRQVASDPLFVPQIILRVGLGAILHWMLHYAALGVYAALDGQGEKWRGRVEGLPARQKYLFKRALDNWRFGAGLDYDSH